MEKRNRAILELAFWIVVLVAFIVFLGYLWGLHRAFAP